MSELLTIDALKDTALVAEHGRGTQLGAALQLTEIRAERADVLLREVVKAVNSSNECGFRCRARRVVYVSLFVGGALVAHKLWRG